MFHHYQVMWPSTRFTAPRCASYVAASGPAPPAEIGGSSPDTAPWRSLWNLWMTAIQNDLNNMLVYSVHIMYTCRIVVSTIYHSHKNICCSPIWNAKSFWIYEFSTEKKHWNIWSLDKIFQLLTSSSWTCYRFLGRDLIQNVLLDAMVLCHPANLGDATSHGPMDASFNRNKSWLKGPCSIAMFIYNIRLHILHAMRCIGCLGHRSFWWCCWQVTHSRFTKLWTHSCERVYVCLCLEFTLSYHMTWPKIYHFIDLIRIEGLFTTEKMIKQWPPKVWDLSRPLFQPLFSDIFLKQRPGERVRRPWSDRLLPGHCQWSLRSGSSHLTTFSRRLPTWHRCQPYS